MTQFDTIIIGSGAGGLSAAVCLARAGQKVAVIEQHYVPGGWCHSFYIDGHRFSPGVHYIGSMDEGQSARKLYEGLGIANELVFFRMNPKGYEHCYIGDEKVDMPAGVENLYESLSNRFPHERKGLKKYLKLIRNVSKQIHLISKMNGFLDNLTIFYRTRHLGKYGLFSLKRVIGWHIKDPLLQKVLNIQCGDHGLPPAKASFPLHCALMDHYLDGGFYPMGGGAAIVKAMTNSVKKNKGEILTGKAVKRILLERTDGKNKFRATGVELGDGKILTAKNIISNADPSVTYKMVGHEYLGKKLTEKIGKTRYSVTSLMFFITVDMDLREAGFDSGNIWLMPNRDMDELYEDLKAVDLLATDELSSLFISCSSLKDPTSYNGREHTIEVVTFIDYDSFIAKLQEGDDYAASYKKCKERLSEKLINSLEKIAPGIRNNIVQMELGTPTTNEYYINATKGNVYGTEKGFWQTGPFSYPNKTEIENLYMCGASIMAHGVSGSSYSGVNAAACVLNCKEEELLRPDESQHVRVYDADDNAHWPPWLIQKISEKQKRVKSRA